VRRALLVAALLLAGCRQDYSATARPATERPASPTAPLPRLAVTGYGRVGPNDVFVVYDRRMRREYIIVSQQNAYGAAVAITDGLQIAPIIGEQK